VAPQQINAPVAVIEFTERRKDQFLGEAGAAKCRSEFINLFKPQESHGLSQNDYGLIY
jgi:hypothetical protein